MDMFVTNRLGLLFMLFFLIGVFLSPPAFAQSGQSDPYSLYKSDFSVANPIIVADVHGGLHVFWIENDLNEAIIPAVFHAALVDSEWSTPVSILVSPAGGTIVGFNAVADRHGGIHAIWYGPNHTLYYSSVDASKASDPRSWSVPVVIASSFTFPGITTDTSGKIYVVYPEQSADAIYIISSIDGGHFWDVPSLVSRSSAPNGGINYTNVVVDLDGNLHVAWSEFKLPNGWPPLGVFVASSTDNGLTWSSPVQLAGEGYDQVNLAVNQIGEVYAFWNGMIGVGGRYISTSLDRGQTWSEPYEVIPQGIGGTSGYPHVVFDSLNKGHMITSLDWQGGIQYLRQDSIAWTAGSEISSKIDYTSYSILSLEMPWLCITQGNILHIVYEAGMEEIFYQQIILEAPTIQPRPFIPAPTVSIDVLPDKTSSPLVDDLPYPNIDDEGMVGSSISQPINLAALCVLGLIFSVYLGKKLRQSR